MSLRWKIALVMAALTMTATVAVGVVGYRLTRERLMAEVDRSLIEVDPRQQRGRLELEQVFDRRPAGGFEAQLVQADGSVVESTFEAPVVDEELAEAAAEVAGHPNTQVMGTVTVDGTSYRVRTVGLPRGSLEVMRSLDETDRVLQSLRARTLMLSIIVAGVAALLGLWLASSVTASLRKMTAAAEYVAATGSLDTPVGPAGNDEVGRLGAAFDRMLAALARSRQQQQRLIEDAGHELRTPLTSLRTNVDVLRRHVDLPPAEREAILADLHAETEELTDLVNEIVSTAVGVTTDEPAEEFDLAVLAADVATRFERRTGRAIAVIAEPSPVVARKASVQRALSCLLDNARKFDHSGGTIEVTVHGRGIAVADRGPGIPPAEVDLVFERFHRATESRSMPGSGLGLSIVRDVAERHGGTVFARNREGGGAVVGFELG